MVLRAASNQADSRSRPKPWCPDYGRLGAYIASTSCAQGQNLLLLFDGHSSSPDTNMAHRSSRAYRATTSTSLLSLLLVTVVDAVSTSMSLDVPFRFTKLGQRAPGDIGDMPAMPAVNRPLAMMMINPTKHDPLYNLPGVPNVTQMLDPKAQFDCSGWMTNTSRRVYVESQQWWTVCIVCHNMMCYLYTMQI